MPLTSQNDPIAAIISGARHCFTIPDNAAQDERGFVPSLVVEGIPGHHPMLGNGTASSPWYWGKTREAAQQVCDSTNESRGLTPEDVKEIVGSSILASFRNRNRSGR